MDHYQEVMLALSESETAKSKRAITVNTKSVPYSVG